MIHERLNHEGWADVMWVVVGACEPALFKTLKEARKYAKEANKELIRLGYPHHNIYIEWRA